MKTKKITEIKNLFNNLFIMDSKEIDKTISIFEKMPNEAQSKLIDLLKKLRTEQDELIKKNMKNDDKFFKRFMYFLDKNFS